VYGLSVARSGCGCEDMGWLNVGQKRSVMVWTGCIWVSVGMLVNEQAVSRSG
jgi:hypothetical protein